MAPKLFRKMNRGKLSCPSQASAAVRINTDRGSTSMQSSGRAIDRTTSQIIDSRRVKALTSLSQLTYKPTSCNLKSCESSQESTDLISAATSSRYLLNDDPTFFDPFPDLEPARAPATIELLRFESLKGDASTCLKPASPQNQVVVLRVSLHCKGCEGKVKKHIAKMEGVTSFNVDLAAKKVTVIGDVTPLGVLNSISKVKHAQLWPSTPKLRPSSVFL